ncbi:uncharacterized protein LOC115880697, partial [Sitophilus oryzae]|uniref:Uncharacterized protein LOC115880697 n=1 Tax=Sitophilus oryzae TaxID=7048 RepID=A0A6J2XTD2_SITOR
GAWSLLRKLGSSNPPTREPPEVSADQIAAKVITLSKAPSSKQQNANIKKQLTICRQKASAHSEYAKSFSVEEVDKALENTKSGKAPGFDGIRPEFLKNCGKHTRMWLKRMLLNRIGPLILEHTPVEQAGFRPHRSCVDQVLSLTTHIEAGFQKQLKTTVVYVDLTAAYDTVWREGLLYKFLVVPCSRIASLLNNMLDEGRQALPNNNRKKKE